LGAQFAQFAPDEQLELLTKKMGSSTREVIPVLRRIIDMAESKPLPTTAIAVPRLSRL
jgi:hypothetical protein